MLLQRFRQAASLREAAVGPPESHAKGVLFINPNEMIDYCLSKDGAYLEQANGDGRVCIKVGQRLFAQIHPLDGEYHMLLPCDFLTGDFYQSLHPGIVSCEARESDVQPCFYSVRLNGILPSEDLRVMIDTSYLALLGQLSRSPG